MRRASIKQSIIIADYSNGTLDNAACELVSAARHISDNVTLGLLCSDSAPAELDGAPTVDSIVGVRLPPDRSRDDALRARAIASILSRCSPDVALVPSSWSWAPAAASAAVSCDMHLASDCVALDTADDGSLLVQRPIYGQKILAELCLPGDKAALVLIKEGCWPAAELASGTTPIDIFSEIEADEGGVTHLKFVEPESDDNEDLKNASIIFAVGRGLGNAEQVELVAKAAQKCGATLAASRPIVDMGLLPRSRQVGQSGLTVNPQIYVAFGISGAPQHLEGMQGSGIVVAINTDRDAPIFAVSDYAAFVDAAEVAQILGND